MGQIAHITVHTAIVSRVLARLERFVTRVGTNFLENTSQYGIGQALGLVGAVVCGNGIVVARADLFVLGALLAAEPLHEPHDAMRDGPGGQLDGAIGEDRVHLIWM